MTQSSRATSLTPEAETIEATRRADDLARARQARAAASRTNRHAIGGDAPEDTDARLYIASNRIRLLGIAATAVAHAEGDLGLPDDEAWRTLGGMLQELAEDIAIAQSIAVAQDWERQLEGGR